MRFSFWRITILGLASSLSCISFIPAEEKTPAPTKVQIEFFEESVRPLLVKHCLACHGSKQSKGELRIDTREALLTGGESGEAIVPGKPEESLLIEAINWESLEMPPKKKLSDSEINQFSKWITMGAPWPKDQPIRPASSASKVTQKDRTHWSFQPVRKQKVPVISNDKWSRNEIDKFILQKQQKVGLAPASEADRRTLIRRVTFDLTGLPPTPLEVEAFVKNENPNAWQDLIERLLDSPAYGEQWGHYWLDVVRYAESDGFRADGYRSNAWRYRDYVINSFNNDKPYDQFVREQIAGDELHPNDPQAMIATGFLRLGIYEHNQRDALTQWDDILNEMTDVTADTFLALGMNCARCHDHKFDPLPQEDYYGLRAFFAPVLMVDEGVVATEAEKQAYDKQYQQWSKETANLREKIQEIEAPARKKMWETVVKKFPEDVESMIRKDAEQRLPFEEQIADLCLRQLGSEGGKIESYIKDKKKLEEWKKVNEKLAGFDSLKPKSLPTARIVRDVASKAPPTFIDRDIHSRVEPHFLTVLHSPGETLPQFSAGSNSTGRRTALAKWLTRPDHPLTARVMVNRIWQYHFVEGLVPTAGDFGSLGTTPLHPELLDWLASEFIERGWSIKEMHRLMLNSATYRQSSLRETPKVAIAKDPGNRLFWRMRIRRLEAEQIRDAMLSVTGELNRKLHGPSANWSEMRRSVYLKVYRNKKDALLSVFDFPDRLSSSAKRNVTTTPTQSLLMMNGPWLLARSEKLAATLKKRANSTHPEDLVRSAYQLLYGQNPTAEQIRNALKFIQSSGNNNQQPEQKPTLKLTMQNKKLFAEILPDVKSGTLLLNDSTFLPQKDFTIEATVLLRSLYSDATVRTIASQWNSSTKSAGWSLGVTSTKSRYKPRNLILQLVGKNAKGELTYEVIPSGIHLELNKTYQVAVSVRIEETDKTGVTFRVKELPSLKDPESAKKIQTSQVAHTVVGHYKSADPFVIGGRAASERHRWDGLVDDLRLSNRAISSTEFLMSNGPNITQGIVGYWKFDSEEEKYQDSVSGHHLNFVNSGQKPISREEQGLIDFCHVLLNSNHFLYVD